MKSVKTYIARKYFYFLFLKSITSSKNILIELSSTTISNIDNTSAY